MVLVSESRTNKKQMNEEETEKLAFPLETGKEPSTNEMIGLQTRENALQLAQRQYQSCWWRTSNFCFICSPVQYIQPGMEMTWRDTVCLLKQSLEAFLGVCNGCAAGFWYYSTCVAYVCFCKIYIQWLKLYHYSGISTFQNYRSHL